MTRYAYAGRTPSGAKINGELEAGSVREAVARLRGRSIVVTSLESSKSLRGAMYALRRSLRPCAGARIGFFRSFAALAGAGIPVRSALETLRVQSDAAFAETIAQVAAEVEGGSALSRAMQAHPRDFSRVTVAIVRAGETAGSLDDALATIADLEERDRTLRKRVLSAAAYPIVVAGASGAVLWLLLANTMPAFAEMFASMHVAVPLATRALIVIGRYLRSPLVPAGTALALSASIAGIRAVRGSQAPWALRFDRARRRLPILGPIATKAAIARFSRTFASLIRAGVDVAAALQTAEGVVESPVLLSSIRSAEAALRRGEPLAEAFAAGDAFDRTFLLLLRSGEESGSVDQMLARLARFYELDVETALSTFTGILEPILICVLGIAVGTIVASILIPLYSMIGAIQ